jgi:carbamoyl-phosphate synthase large subunit
VVVRPSYVLGGRAMEIVHDKTSLLQYTEKAVLVSNDSPVLIDRYLNDATEVDVDAICDGKQVLIGGIMEHVEEAGVHSGDSACSLPPYSLTSHVERELRRQTTQLAKALKVVGLMNVQYAIQRGTVYVLEVNPRASRSLRFQGDRPAAGDDAARRMVGRAEQRSISDAGYSVRAAPPPFPGVNILGPR